MGYNPEYMRERVESDISHLADQLSDFFTRDDVSKITEIDPNSGKRVDTISSFKGIILIRVESPSSVEYKMLS